MQHFTISSCLVALAALPAQSPHPDQSAPRAPQSLARVVFDQPRADGPLWACGNAWKASFDGRGFTAIPFFGSDAPQNHPLRVEVAKASVGGDALSLRDGMPTNPANQVMTRRGAFTEVIDTGLDRLEQSFVFDALPNRGAIVVDVTIGGEGYVPSVIENGLRFTTERGHVDYTKAVAIDGNGRRLALPITWTGTVAHLEIPASFVETAALPIVLDPVLNFWFALGNPSLVQHDGDVATIQLPTVNGRTLLVWQRQWSLVDQDCWGLMFDNDLNLVLTDFTIDFTSEDWLKPACAGNNYAQNFLCVSEVRVGAVYFIAGRLISIGGLPSTQFDIERDGVVGSGGNNRHPDVGSDPYFGPGRYTVVFNKTFGGASDIYMRQVTTSGGQVTTNPVLVEAGTTSETRPSISKSCGQSNGLPAYWLVAWQRTYTSPPFDEDIQGRFVNWNGAFPGNSFTIDFSGSDDTAPSASSPIDVNGIRYWPVCYASAFSAGQRRDLDGRLLRSDGTSQLSFAANAASPLADHSEPEIDSDGLRFVIVHTVTPIGAPRQIEAATFSYLPTMNAINADDRTSLGPTSTDNYAQGNVVAEFSGGGTFTSRYRICLTEQTPNTLRLVNFGGWAGTGPFFSTFPTQCGTLPISSSGTPMLGQTMTVTAGNGAASALIAGTPSIDPLLPWLGCNCTLGVSPIGYFTNPFVWAVPRDPLLVGRYFSVQAFTILGSQCLGALDFSDTVDFMIR